MALSDPTAVRTLISPEAELTDINKPLRWISFLMALYYHGVSPFGLRQMVLCPQDHRSALDNGNESLALARGFYASGRASQREHRLH